MKYLYIVLFVITGTLVSCVEDDTNGVSRITDYPIITVNGPTEIFVTQGSSYKDAGAVSKEGGAEIETTTKITSGDNFGLDFSVNAPDKYVVTYSAVNKDGFAGSALKTVWVVPTKGDLVNSIEGLYLADCQRAPSFTPSAQYNGLKYVFIKKTGANTYAISHAIGGYYDMGRNYGPAYAAKGAIITANNIAANDFSFTGANIPGFGLDINISEFKVFPATKTITYTGAGNFGNGTFKVQLKQVQ